ncbi:MAG: MFS transporter [Lachnospiraceae bacterium]|nr:MFS transporter [Lachnospiraceae bacterium]
MNVIQRRKKYLFCGILIFFIVLFIWTKRDFLSVLPFPSQITFHSPTNIFVGKNDTFYLINNGKKEVLLINKKLQYETKIKGGNEDKPFYYASMICDDEAGNIYLANVDYAGKGTLVKSERIIQYDKKGKNAKTLYEIKYEDEDNAPLQYGNIIGLTEKEGHIYFILKGKSKIQCYNLDLKTGKNTCTSYPVSLAVNDAVLDIQSKSVIASTRQGEIYKIEEDGNITILMDSKNQEQIPWKLTMEGNTVYYTDLLSKSVKKLSIESEESVKTVFDMEEIPYTINASNNGTLVGTDYSGIYLLDKEGNFSYFSSVNLSNRIMRIGIWLLIFLLTVFFIVLFFRLILKAVRHLHNRETLFRVILIVIPSLIIAIIISIMLISKLLDTQTKTTMRDIKLFSDILLEDLDATKLQEIKNLSDYGGKTYVSLKEKADELVRTSYENGLYYYYTIYKGDGNFINAVFDYEQTVTVNHPMYEYGDNAYSYVYKNGKAIEVNDEVSSYGAWSYILTPIHSENGEIIGILEVGTNMDNVHREQKTLIMEVVFTIITTVVVIIMFIIEIIFLISHMERKNKTGESEIHYFMHYPLRSILFIIYLVDSMQDAFIALLSSRLYEPIIGIPKSMGIALPITMQLLMAALFSVIGGRFVSLLGTRKNMIFGFLCQFSGLLICALSGNYIGLLIGKIFIGIGMGTIYVTANTLAAMGDTEEHCEQAFADINAGVLSGITVGVGLGSIILSFGDYQLVYLVGAIISISGLALAFTGKSIKPTISKKAGNIKMKEFLLNKRVITFFLFLLLPFMMALSYREYFFPLYVEKYGMTEVEIGRFYLACGLIVLYIGPFLAKWLIGKFGSGKSVILASGLMCVNMLLFAISPSLLMAMLSIMIFSVIVSFAYTCQYTYFGMIPETSSYGEGNAMGIYSLFENGGQTLGPIAYGTALLFGNRFGIGCISLIMGALIILFSISNSKSCFKNSVEGECNGR